MTEENTPKEVSFAQVQTPTTSWGGGTLDDEGPEGSWKPVKVLVGILVALVVIGGAAAAYFFLLRSPSAAAVSLTGTVPGEVYGGQPFDLVLHIKNTSTMQLQEPTLLLIIPDGVDLTEEGPSTRSKSIALDTLDPNKEAENTVNLVAQGEPNTIRKVKATLRYRTPSSGDHTFETFKDIEVALGVPAVSLTIDGPQYVTLGESFGITLRYKNNLGEPFPAASLKLAFPPTYTLASANPAPNQGKDQWNLPALQPGQEGTIEIRGAVAGGRNETFPFSATIIAGAASQAHTVIEQLLAVQLLPTPLRVAMTVEGKQEAVVDIGDTVSYNVLVKNVTSFPIENLTVASKLASPLFDEGSVNSQGNYSSANNVITWNVASTPSLRTLAPGDEVQLSFSVRMVKNFPIASANDKNFTATVETTADSPTVPANTATDRVRGSATSTIKLAGILDMDAQAYWTSGKTGITNKGPYPPHVDQPTQYVIRWVMTSQAADMKSIRLSASLQSGATWTGVVKSNLTSQPVYNKQTGEVTWDILLLPANRGRVGAPAEAFFQIEQTPSANQVGRDVTILSRTILTATDGFTGIKISEDHEALTTSVQDDAAAPSNGSVTQ